MKLIPIVLLASFAAQAKPLYLTVPRSYGTSEKPMIDVAFEAKGPVELRILKPQSIDAFVAAQADLRRAYLEPPAYKNPGRALSRGLNAMKGPGDYLLYALGKAFRKELAEAIPPRPASRLRALPRLAEGPARVVGTPPGMQLVHSEWLNLDLGGASREFDVPGFGMWAGESGYQERHIALDPLPPGIYLVQVVQERVEGQVTLVVTDLAVQVKQTDGKLLARVAGRDQKPRAGAFIQVWWPGGGKAASGKTDDKGEVTLSVEEPKVVVTASSGKDIALVDTDFYSTLAVASDVFLYSDRPVYKPGDEVRFRGLLRKPDGVLARLFNPRQREVEVELISQEGRKIATTAEVDEFGSFHGTLAVPRDITAGVLRISANVDDREHQGEARAQDYVKPTFHLELTTESEAVQPGGTLKAKVRARRFAGGIPSNARYEVYLYRSQLESPSWVDDAGMGGQGSAVTYGSQSTTEGSLSIPERLYSSLQERMNQHHAADPWTTAPLFDDKGEANLEIPVPPLAGGDERLPFRYSLTVRARDDQGTFANAASSLFLSPVEVLGVARFSAPIVRTGNQLTFSLRSTSLSGKSRADTEGGVELFLRRPDGEERKLADQTVRTGSDGVVRLPALAREPGTIIARAWLKDARGGVWRGEAQSLVAGGEGVPIAHVPALTLSALGGAVEPGSRAQLIALLPDSWGPGGRDGGPLWVTLSGTTLFSTRLVELKGRTLIHSFDIERRFGSAVYAAVSYPTRDGRWEERAVSFRVVPAQRTLNVKLEPLKAEAQPLTGQSISLVVTDWRGRGVRAQVSIGVVDKAVYAIQSEFRPRVLDFFYPLVRDNVQSFTSGEFQGYGYGEELAHLFSRAPRHAFAAVKPPTRQRDDKERDTAYWEPDMTTSADGRATVSFKLPSNQTLWTVTAVAADAEGRFGEGTAEFASRGDLDVYASLPQFLREGDQVMGSVRLSAGKAAPALAVSIAGGGAVQGLGGNDRVELKQGGEAVVPVRLIAQRGGAAEVAVEVRGGKEPLHDRRAFAVREGVIEEVIQVSRWGAGQLQLELPPGAVVESAELSLRASTVDVALATVRDLLTYPYGCLEQLIATSVPNIAVAQLLGRVGGEGKLDAESQALLSEARSRAVQGIQRVLQLEVKGGGFGWYSDGEPSLPMTLIALDGLAYAAQAQLVDRNDARLVESVHWLEAQEGVPFELDAARAYVLARLDGADAAPRVRAVLDKAQPGGDLYPLALAVLAAETAGVLHEASLQKIITRVIEASRDGFVSPASYQVDTTGAYWRWPVRAVGRMAVVGHAASLGGVDLGTARRRLVEMLSEPGLSTFDKSTAILHSLWLIERDAKDFQALAPVAIEAPVKVALQPRGSGLFANLGTSAGPVRLGHFEGAAVLRARIKTPLRAVQAKASGMSIARRYFALREGGQRDHVASLKVELLPGARINLGEEIYVELAIDAGGRGRRSAYTVVEDQVPAGFVPLQEDKAFRAPPHALPLAPEALKRRTFSPERVSFFLEEPAFWSDHPRSVGYVMRAQFAGKFTAPPATVEDMYAASLHGRTAAALLEVAEGQ